MPDTRHTPTVTPTTLADLSDAIYAAALADALVSGPLLREEVDNLAAAVEPVIAAALAAERERIAQAIEDTNAPSGVPGAGMTTWWSGIVYAADIARGTV